MNSVKKLSFDLCRGGIIVSLVMFLQACDEYSDKYGPTLAESERLDEDVIISDGETGESEMLAGEDIEDEEPTFRAWTGWTSEEFPPLECTSRRFVRGFECNYRYCDNVRMDCYYTGVSYGDSSWSSYFSEEGSGGADERHCAWGDFMTGIACSGRYCDNISIECTEAIGKGFANCNWSGWYSEEQGPFQTPSGYYIKGIECDGSYCDNKRFRYCRMVNG
ncbi:MAG: hypothetical protein QNJ97_10795 [Myxococcota bacterium]|nr:hypothetical protein [Myxococcota bacterium]